MQVNAKSNYSFTGLVPRNLYHLTSESNYQKMLQDGFIRPIQSDASGANIFMIELNNFVTKWKNIVFNFQRGQQLQATGNPNNAPVFFDMRQLIRKTGMAENFLQMLYPNNLVQSLLAKTNPMRADRTIVLKIPTKNLDIESLFIRDQLKANNFVCSQEFKDLMSAFMQHMASVKQSLGNNWNIRTQEEYNKFFSAEFEKFISNEQKKLISGDTAKNSKLYKMQGKSIEYLYRKPIDVAQVEVAGKLDLNTAQNIAIRTPKPYRTLLEMLFDGKGEKKAVEQMSF